VKPILSNIPPPNTRHVLVEGFDYESEVDGTLDSSEVQFEQGFDEIPLSNPSSFGVWVELVAIALFAFASIGVLSNFSLIWGNLGVMASMFLSSIGVMVAFTSGHRDGDPSGLRMTTAIVLAIAGAGFAVLSLVQGGLSVWVWPTAIALTCSIAFWSLLRLTGETTLRCLSLGAAAAVPLIMVVGPLADSFYTSVDRVAVWFASTFFDMATIAYGIRDLGFQFVGGEISSMASSNNYTGIAGPIGLALATSVILRQSMILTTLSGLIAVAWWSIFRGLVCLSAVQNSQIDGTWDSIAMPFYGLLMLLVVIAGTQVFLSSFFAPLPLDHHPIDHPILPQLYNMVVSFPQTGPKHGSLFAPYQRRVDESNELVQVDEDNDIAQITSGTVVNEDGFDQDGFQEDAEDWEPAVKSNRRFDRKSPSE